MRRAKEEVTNDRGATATAVKEKEKAKGCTRYLVHIYKQYYFLGGAGVGANDLFGLLFVA